MKQLHVWRWRESKPWDGVSHRLRRNPTTGNELVNQERLHPVAPLALGYHHFPTQLYTIQYTIGFTILTGRPVGVGGVGICTLHSLQKELVRCIAERRRTVAFSRAPLTSAARHCSAVNSQRHAPRQMSCPARPVERVGQDEDGPGPRRRCSLPVVPLSLLRG